MTKESTLGAVGGQPGVVLLEPTWEQYCYEERAAILEYEAGFTRKEAELRASIECGRITRQLTLL